MTGPTGPFLLAVDAGTGSCRALLFSAAGEQAAVSLREWTHREPPDAPGGQDFGVEANGAANLISEGAAERIFAEAGDWVPMLNPVAMIRSAGAVVHESLKPQAAYDRFLGEPGRQASPSP